MPDVRHALRACTTHTHTHARTCTHVHALTHARSQTHACTRARTHTHPHIHTRARAHTYTHTNARIHAKNLFSRTFCTSREYGYLKINGMDNTGSAISGRIIDEIEEILQGFQEYDFDLKISNWATRIKSFTCTTFLLLTASLLRISCEIEKLKKYVWKCVNPEGCT